MWHVHHRIVAFASIAIAIMLFAGCGGSGSDTSESEAGPRRTYERGPISLEFSASTDTLSTADTLRLTLAATVEDGYSVDFPAYPEPEEDSAEAAGAAEETGPETFTLANYEDTPPELRENGRVQRSRVYYLEPFLDGTYEIPPLEVAFWKEVEGEDQKNTIETEPLSITVVSVIAAGAEPGLKDIAGPRSVQAPFPWIRWTVIALLVAALAGALYWYQFKYTPPVPPPPAPVPPHQRALEALEEIRRSKLVEKGLYKEYYIRVSDVLRRYMEEQFQLRAPERTTEEFLEDLQHNAALGLQEQLLLREFLRHCDLVKFARAEPTSEQINETMETCERFIVDSEAAVRAARESVPTKDGED